MSSPQPAASTQAKAGPTRRVRKEAAPVTRRQPGLRDQTSSSHGALIASSLVAIAAIGFAGAWWAENLVEPSKLSALVRMPAVPGNADNHHIMAMQRPAAAARTADATSHTLAPASVKAPATPEPSPTGTADELPGQVKLAATSQASSTKKGNENNIASQIPAPRTVKGIETPSAAHQARKKSKQRSSQLGPGTKKERVKEIDRVRTQAFSETPKDRKDSDRKAPTTAGQFDPQSRNSKSKTRNTTRLSKKQRTVYALNKCAHSGNFIEREKCKWKVCGGSWGKNGCPSYGRQEMAAY